MFTALIDRSYLSLRKQLLRNGAVFLFVRDDSYMLLPQQPHRGWSVGRAGLANGMSLPCLRYVERKQGRRSWSPQAL